MDFQLKKRKKSSIKTGLWKMRGRERKEERWMVGSVGTEEPPALLQPPVMRQTLLVLSYLAQYLPGLVEVVYSRKVALA